jgi:hypothetical protein
MASDASPAFEEKAWFQTFQSFQSFKPSRSTIRSKRGSMFNVEDYLN